MQRLRASNFQLDLAPAEDRIQWVAQQGDHSIVHETEPHADWLGQWRLRLRLRLLSMLVPEDLL